MTEYMPSLEGRRPEEPWAWRHPRLWATMVILTALGYAALGVGLIVAIYRSVF